MKNPGKFTKYKIDWDEKEGSNAAAAAATFEFLRKRKELEPKADLNQGFVFKSRGSAQPKAEGANETSSRKKQKHATLSYDKDDAEDPEEPGEASFIRASKKKRNFRKKKTDHDEAKHE